MTAAAPSPSPRPTIRIQFRDAEAGDEAYILDSWRLGWRLSQTCKRDDGTSFARRFKDIVRDGVLAQPDTRVLVGCCTADPSWIWSWCCYTPGAIPTIHFVVVRPFVDALDGDRTPLRRAGIATRMLAAVGVRDELVYTFRPAERTNPTSKVRLNLESGLLAAARRDGITAVYRSVERFLKTRREAP